MPTINESPSDKEKNLHHTIAHLTNEGAQVYCGVQRKINIGNFESIDVYCAASIPVPLDDVTDFAETEEKIIAAMEHLIYLTSKETAEKYNAIKSN